MAREQIIVFTDHKSGAVLFARVMRAIFRHLGFGEGECATAVELASPQDIARMNDQAITENRHIHSRTLSKWRDFLSEAQLRRFEDRAAQ